MITIAWDAKFSVGHERIDHEHQVFLDLIKNASLAEYESAPRERILRLLMEVRKYAEFHFYSEENIMIDHRYPELDRHRGEHEVLLAKLDESIQDYREGTISLGKLVEFLFQWFALHTAGSDKQLTAFIGKR